MINYTLLNCKITSVTEHKYFSVNTPHPPSFFFFLHNVGHRKDRVINLLFVVTQHKKKMRTFRNTSAWKQSAQCQAALIGCAQPFSCKAFSPRDKLWTNSQNSRAPNFLSFSGVPSSPFWLFRGYIHPPLYQLRQYHSVFRAANPSKDLV